MTAASEQYRPEIDGIRAIAVCAVIALHAGAPLSGGFAGVDVFFVLSGFLITIILARDLAEKRFNLFHFYERRIRRILPMLFVVVFASVPIAFALMPPADMQAFERSIVALMVFATNVKFWMEAGYFAPSADLVPLLHTWSLAVEEQYYLIFPVLLWVLSRMERGTDLRALALLLGASLVTAEWTARVAPSAAFYLLPFRIWELLAGSLTGLVVNQKGLPDGTAGAWHASRRFANLLSLAGLAFLLGSLVFLKADMELPGLVMIPTIGGTVLLLLYAQPGTIAHRVLTQRYFVGIGLISYSAYLWHQPLFAFARLAQIGRPTGLQMSLLVTLTFGLAYVSWRFVEQPFRNPKQISRLSVLSAMGGAAAALTLIGVTGHLGRGLGSLRFSPSQLAMFQGGTISPKRATCAETRTTSTACRYFGNSLPSWAVLGDSHSVEIAFALAEQLQPAGDALIQFSRPACPPAIGYEANPPGCAAWNSEVLDWIDLHSEIHTVVLAWRHSLYLKGPNEPTFPILPDDTFAIRSGVTPSEKRDLYWQGLSKLIARVKGSGRNVILVDPVPEIGVNLDRYFMWRGVHDRNLKTIDLQYYYERNKYFFDRKAALGVTSVAMDSICNNSSCFGIMDQIPLYFDDDHLSVEGARRVVSSIFAQHESFQGHAK